MRLRREERRDRAEQEREREEREQLRKRYPGIYTTGEPYPREKDE